MNEVVLDKQTKQNKTLCGSLGFFRKIVPDCNTTRVPLDHLVYKSVFFQTQYFFLYSRAKSNTVGPTWTIKGSFPSQSVPSKAWHFPHAEGRLSVFPGCRFSVDRAIQFIWMFNLNPNAREATFFSLTVDQSSSFVGEFAHISAIKVQK